MSVSLVKRRRLPKATAVFDSYWQLAAERQRIFRARLRGAPPPLTTDPILQEFKFTNAYRASDRTSQYLIRRVIYDSARTWQEAFVRVLLFKLFNRIETWELIHDRLGDPSAGDLIRDVKPVLDAALGRGDRIYSAAYIMPSATNFGRERKHDNHLLLLSFMLEVNIPERIADAVSMEEAFNILVRLPSLGPFLAYQRVTDLNYTPHLNFAEDEFVMPGPGALDGLAKCFSDPGDLSAPEIIRWTMETQSNQFVARGINFEDLWERPLQLVDCQNIYCEVDKYARVAHPDARGLTGRSRIKQRFRPRGEPLSAWYPPKWGLNERVQGWLTDTAKDSSLRSNRVERENGPTIFL